MDSKCVCCVMIFVIAGVESGTLLFIDIENQPQNASSTSDLCKNMTGLEASPITSGIYLQDVAECAERISPSGLHWSDFGVGRIPEGATFMQCTFENNDHCFLHNVSQDGYYWSLRKSFTPSMDTGPFEAAEGTYFAYTEASNMRTGQEYILESSKLPVKEMCLYFRYHMYGEHIGKLMVIVESETNYTLWQREGDQSHDRDNWLSAYVNITNLNRTATLRIVGVRGNGLRGDIALDDVRLKYGPCIYSEENACGDMVYGDTGTLISQRYPETYPRNTKCVWRIFVPIGYNIQLRINEFQLEPEFNNECIYDYLKITDTQTSSSIYLLCGTHSPGLVLNTSSESIIVEFSTDHTQQRKGFNITWEAVRVSCTALNISNGEVDPIRLPCDRELPNVVCAHEEEEITNLQCRQFKPEITTELTTVIDATEATKNNMTTKRNLATEKSNRISTAIIAGVVCAVVACVITVTIISIIFCRRRKQNKKDKVNLRGNVVQNQVYTLRNANAGQQSPPQLAPNSLQQSEFTRQKEEIQASVNETEVYENTQHDNENIYNHLNELTVNVGNDYSQYGDVSTYDHLPSEINIKDSDTGGFYDHASTNVKGLKSKLTSQDSVYMNTVSDGSFENSAYDDF